MPTRRIKPGPHQDPIAEHDYRLTRSWPETIDGENVMISASDPYIPDILAAIMQEPIRTAPNPAVQSAADNQRGVQAPTLEQRLREAFKPLMNPKNGYEGVTKEDIKAMLYDNVPKMKGAAKFGLEEPGSYEAEMARIQSARDAISRGDPAVFDGSFDGPLGYYAGDSRDWNKTGMQQVGPGGPPWNPNRAQANLLIMQTLLEEGYKAGLAAKQKSGKRPVVQSAKDNQRGR